jgi:hypothetical protein
VIVDDDHLDAREKRAVAEDLEAAERFGDQVLLVVDRNEDGK